MPRCKPPRCRSATDPTPMLDGAKLVRSARAVIATEARAIEVLHDRIDGRFLRACQLMFECAGPRRRFGHGQVRPHRAQDRRDAGLDRHAVVLRASGRSQPRRSRHDHAEGRRARAVQFRRDRRAPDDPAADQAPGHSADRHERQRRILARRASPTCISTPACRPKPARSASRRPRARPRRWSWAMRSRSRCSKRAVSPTRISRARIRPAASAASCCCKISDVMHTGEQIPSVSPDASLTEALVEMTRKGLGMTAIVDDEQHLLGVFTDGDLRRAVDDDDIDLRATPVTHLMTAQPEDDLRRQARDRSGAADGSAQDPCAARRRRGQSRGRRAEHS